MNKNLKKIILFSLIFLILIFIICLLRKKEYVSNKQDWNLELDGLVLYKNIFNDEEINFIKNNCVNNEYKITKNFLHNHYELNDLIKDKSYEFQDYIWVIQKSSVHTCHRDNNGDFFNKGQKYPSYTMLIYLEDMKSALGFIPSSHKKSRRYYNFFNIFDPLTHLSVKKGDVILFNANLIHVGSMDNDRDDNIRIQLKITHKDDRQIISYYEDFNKVLKKDNKIPKILRKCQKNLSCMFPLISDFTQKENIYSARGSDNGVKIGLGQQLFSKYFYGDSKFYDLPNAF